jgi:hypothetical protein
MINADRSRHPTHLCDRKYTARLNAVGLVEAILVETDIHYVGGGGPITRTIWHCWQRRPLLGPFSGKRSSGWG